MDQIELETYDDHEYLSKMSEQLEYPCAVIEGVTTEEEFAFLRNHKNDLSVSIPLFCSVDGLMCRVGLLELSLDRFLTLRSISDYKISIYRSENDCVPIDLNDPENLINFIKL